MRFGQTVSEMCESVLVVQLVYSVHTIVHSNTICCPLARVSVVYSIESTQKESEDKSHAHTLTFPFDIRSRKKFKISFSKIFDVRVGDKCFLIFISSHSFSGLCFVVLCVWRVRSHLAFGQLIEFCLSRATFSFLNKKSLLFVLVEF